MSVWAKERIIFQLINWSTGGPDSGSYTVKLQPIDQTYPNGAVSCSQASSDASLWRPDADLDTTKHYDIYVDGTNKKRLFSPESEPQIGGQ